MSHPDTRSYLDSRCADRIESLRRALPAKAVGLLSQVAKPPASHAACASGLLRLSRLHIPPDRLSRAIHARWSRSNHGTYCDQMQWASLPLQALVLVRSPLALLSSVSQHFPRNTIFSCFFHNVTQMPAYRDIQVLYVVTYGCEGT